MQDAQPSPGLETFKLQARNTWMAGDYGKIAQPIMGTAEEFMARRSIRPGMRVLDLACGTGNLAIPAARAGAEVVGVDIASNLLEQARSRAGEEGLAISFEEGDAEDLAYPDESFDLVVTMFGAMFAPRPDRTAAEMLRVCRPGGQIAMANWTPVGFAGQMFRAVANHVPPAQVPPPVLWGDEQVVRERLGKGSSRIDTSAFAAEIRYPFAPAAVVDHFRQYFGPVRNAFEALPEAQANSLYRDLVALWSEHNEAKDDTTFVKSEYLDVTATRCST